MERITVNRNYDTNTTLENQGPADQGRAEVTAAAQDPANGLNRAISIEKSESFAEVLDESKTIHKSLCDRICDLWLIRKITGLFKKLLTCSRKETCSGKNVASSSKHAGKLMKIGDCAVWADRLFSKVHTLVVTTEKQDLPLDQWVEVKSSLGEISDELAQLKRNISAFKSRKFDYDKKALDYLVTQERKIKSHVGWIRFYLASNKKDNYRDLAINYFIQTLNRFHSTAKWVAKGRHDAPFADLKDFLESATQKVMEMVDKGHISTALVRVEKFRSLVCKLAADAGLLDAFNRQMQHVEAMAIDVR